MKRLYTCGIILLLLLGLTWSQTTGKITGRVTSSDTGLPLAGANIIIDGTHMGTAADGDGSFIIINVPPGTYTVMVHVIGYESQKITDVIVSVNRSFRLDVSLKSTHLEGQMVVVKAERIAQKRDQTSTVKNVSSDQIEVLPVESLNQVVEMQAGVVAGHFRGGRNTEVTYLIDGIQVDEIYDGTGRAVDVEAEAVQDLEVITGTFNAEYGNAMSGVVNAITKDGGNEFHGNVSIGLGNFITDHSDIFIGLKMEEFNRNQDYKFQLSGPVIQDKVFYFLNYRYQDNLNHLNGIQRYTATDSSDFRNYPWYSEHSGDNDFRSMNGSENMSLMTKLSFFIFESIRFSLLYTLNDDEWNDYSHEFKYNPTNKNASYRESNFFSLNINHMISNSLFYEFKLSYLDNYSGWYLYEDPQDDRYVHDRYLSSYGPGFNTGGQQAEFNRYNEFQGKGHSRRNTEDYGAKWDLTWQINNTHNLKTGIDYTQHILDNRWYLIQNAYAGTELENLLYEPTLKSDTTQFADVYKVEPFEWSVFLQDKMEFDEMVINLGLRYDYFDPNTVYPTEWRNPGNQLQGTGFIMSDYPAAEVKEQVSPRFGLAYQLGNAAVLHFSYGHFFQVPQMQAMFQNHSYHISDDDYITTLGNPQLKPQKTVSYEVGLWQELTAGLGLEVALFYRDVYDLLSTTVITTFNNTKYGLYTNKDYSNARGLEVKVDFLRGPLSAYVNYTLQYARGNADNAEQTLDRDGNDLDPVNRLIAMSWDQRHTLNATVGYNTGASGFSLTGYYNSGTPYTFTPLEESRLARINLYPNNDYMIPGYYIDFSGYYQVPITDWVSARFTLSIYNLFDQLNESWVNGQTGRAYSAILEEADYLEHQSDFNTILDTVQDPSSYRDPRQVKLSMSLTF